VAEVAGQGGAVGVGALDTCTRYGPVLAGPIEELTVAVRGGRELGVGDFAAEVVDDRGVVGVAVGVHTEDHVWSGSTVVLVAVMLSIAGLVPIAPDQGRRVAARVGGQDSDGASRTGSYEVTPSSVVRAGDAVAETSRPILAKDNTPARGRQSTAGHTRPATAPSAS